MQSRADLVLAEAKIEAFLTDLAIQGNVAVATQNQAMNVLVFLYKRVLHHPLEDRINAVRADKKVNVPVVQNPYPGESRRGTVCPHSAAIHANE